jgi:hypothetical protein
MAFICSSCGRKFSESRGLGIHRSRYCKDPYNVVSWVNRRNDDHDNEGEDDMLVDEDALDLGDNAELELLPEPDLAPQAPPMSVSFSGRKRKVPRALKDYVPHSLAGLPLYLHPASPIPTPAGISAASPSPPPDPAPEPEILRTDPTGFGLHREYTREPRVDPDDDIAPEKMRNNPDHGSDASSQTPFFHPFPNATVYRLINWFYRASATKSMTDLDSLVHEVILAEDFNPEDLRNFRISREMDRLDAYGATSTPFSAEDDWKEGSVTIRVPNAKSRYASESAAPAFQVSGIYYRPLLEVIKGAFQRPDVQGHHWVPFKWFHHSSESQERVYSDIYNSDAMLEEDAKIQALPRNPEDGSDTEVAIGAIMLWSDSTHLTNFGSAALWPIYLFFGNLSKYARGMPSTLAAHHLAYIPSVSVHSVLT